MAEREPIGVGVVGLGFMGRTHLSAYQSAADAGLPCRVVAVSDADPDRLSATSAATGNLPGTIGHRALFDPTRTAAYTDARSLFADPAVQLVSICTYTDSHVPMAIAALAAGKHVLVEKPVALGAPEIERLAGAAAAAGRLCMPAMCMRFWPGWAWLREAIRAGTYGPVRSAVFQRLGARPRWGREFYGDPERSGGALVDLHIHDADFITWCFGVPESVRSAGSLDHVTTLYRFRDGPAHVVAEGGTDHAPGFGFRMRYVVAFESATADFDFARHDPLLLCRDDTAEPVPLPRESAYEQQVRHIVQAVAEGHTDLRATLAEAAAVARVLDAERESLRAGDAVRPRS